MKAAADELELRAGGPAARRHRGARRAMEKQAVVLATARTPTCSPSPRMSSRRRCRSSTSAADGSAASAAGSWTRSRTSPTGVLVEHVLQQIYGGGRRRRASRARSWCRCCRRTPRAWRSWLAGLRGARVSLRVPQRGDKRALMETVTRNADQALGPHKLNRAGDLTDPQPGAGRRSRTRSDLNTAPLRIECFDVSHVQGTNVVASMVVFEDGLPRKASTAGSSHGAIGRRARSARRRRHGGHARGGDPAVQALSRRPGRAGDIDGHGARDAARPWPTRPEVTDRRRLGAQPDRPGDRPAAAVRVPAQPGGGRRRRAAGRRRPGGAGRARASTTSPWAGWPSGWRRCGCPARRAGDPAAHQRGPVPAAAGARRGAPLRDHVPPAEAVEGDDDAALDGVPGLGETGARRCCGTSARSSGSARPRWSEIVAVPGIGRRACCHGVRGDAARPGDRDRARPSM